MNRTPKSYAHLMCGAAIAALMSYAGAAEAADASYDIASQPLAMALKEFGMKTGQPVLYGPALADEKVSSPVVHAPDPETALMAMLEGTGLSFRRNGETFLIVRASDPQSGSAAGAGAEGTVQALIVTAQKREEDIQDVPIAISAFTQEDLTRSQIAGGPDLMTQVPNFTFTKTNFSSYSIQIRGIGTQAISATVDPAVAVAFNNTPFIRNRFFEQEFYDLQRVEVLRGPQGTLYGRNATAGVVNIISAKPTFQYAEKLSADVANYRNTRLEGMVNIPLVEDKVALRVAGAWTKRDGYDTNQITGNQIDGRDLWSTRVSLRIEPTDNIHANLVWEHFQEDDDRLRSGKQLCHKDVLTHVGDIPAGADYYREQQWYSQGCASASLYSEDSFQTPNGFALPYYRALFQLGLPGFDNFDPYLSTTQSRNLRVIESAVDPVYRAKSDLGELQLSFDMGKNLTLTSETGYNADVIFSLEDFNRFNTAPGAFNKHFFAESVSRQDLISEDGVFCDPQVGCSDRIVAVDLSTAKSRQFSQEFRLSSAYGGSFNFSLGANFLRYDTEDKYYVFINSLTATAANEFLPIFEAKMPPWQAGVSDNHECLPHGMVLGDPRKVQTVIGCAYIDPNPVGSLNDLGHNYFLSKNPYKLISYAAFGEVYYDITPSLKLTAGLRWTVDRKEAPEIPSWLLSAFTVGYPVLDTVRQEWREPTGRITLDWKPDLGFTDETLVYASYAHGYKAGGANPPPTAIIAIDTSTTGLQGPGAQDRLAHSLAHPKTFDPEFVNAFEVGSKNTLADGKVTLNGDVFYYDYTGYQISEIVDRAAINFNFDAEVWGAELEAEWRPLENLRLGFKGGYESTRVADGSKAIDLIDRTAGDPNWVVTKAFPTVPSNCIMPVWVATWGGQIHSDFGRSGTPDTNPGFCVLAYQDGLDPFTFYPYVPNPTVVNDIGGPRPIVEFNPGLQGYPGFDPSTAPNNGEGIAKNLGGKALPNAPHFTTTATVDYTLPLPHDWLLTLHTDLYRQSAAWARIFNDNPYDRIRPYTNVNIAAIFSNEDAGWNVMAYVKNVFDKDNITGAFLNSDDTGLTTNVFLNEPRLYGLRVTKQWDGTPLWGSADGPKHDPNLPYPLRVELGGMVQRQDAPYRTLTPGFTSSFPAVLDTLDAQNRDLDHGDGRQVKITYQPDGASWFASIGTRFGKANSSDRTFKQEEMPGGCLLEAHYCDKYGWQSKYVHPINDAHSRVTNHEDSLVADFAVGKDVGIGARGKSASTISLGMRYAQFNSKTDISTGGRPDIALPGVEKAGKYNIIWHRYAAELESGRKFKGAGPVLSWDDSRQLLGDDSVGHVDLDWSVTGGVLFGKQNTRVSGYEQTAYYNQKYPAYDGLLQALPITPDQLTRTPINVRRSHSATVPTLELGLGLSYEIERIKLSTGYRWERYYNAVDGGYAEHKSYDRTIDGPYFKVSVGFGG